MGFVGLGGRSEGKSRERGALEFEKQEFLGVNFWEFIFWNLPTRNFAAVY